MPDSYDPSQDVEPQAGGGPVSLPVIEEPLDPANQSLADALRASFRVLKVVMILVLVVYLCSGFFIVDRTETAILTRFGRRVSEDPLKAGLHVAWPYPIDQVQKVPMDTQTLEIRSFWMNLSKEDEAKPLSQLMAAQQSLDPAVDGALLTAVERWPGIERSAESAELVHVKWTLSYRVVDPIRFAETMVDPQATIRAVFEAASTAMAVRFTVDDIAFTNQSAYRVAVHEDAQRRLDALGTGIRIEQVNNVPYQPLQVKREFDEVIRAENDKQAAIKAGEQEAKRVLNETAGDEYAGLLDAIRRYEQARASGSTDAIVAIEKEIDDLLRNSKGTASDIVNTARARSEQIVQELEADAATIRSLKASYEQNPVLLPVRLWEDTKRNIFASNGVTQFFMPPGLRQLVIWLNRDQLQMQKQQEEAARKSPGQEGKPTP